MILGMRWAFNSRQMHMADEAGEFIFSQVTQKGRYPMNTEYEFGLEHLEGF